MTFRGAPQGFTNTGVVFQTRDFDKFATNIREAGELLQGLNRNINSAVDGFNAAGRTNASTGRSFAGLAKNIQQSVNSFGTGIRRGAQDLFFFQSAARQAVNGIEAVGTALLAPVGTAIGFEDAFAGVTKTIEDLTDLEVSDNAFVVLTPQGEALKDSLVELSTQIPVTFNELSRLAQLGGQFGLTTRTQNDIRALQEELAALEATGDTLGAAQLQAQIAELRGDVNETIVEFTRTVAGLGEATDLTAEQAGTFIARVGTIFQDTSPENIRALASTLVDLGNNASTTEPEIAQLALRIAGTGQSVGLTEAQVLGLASAFSSVGVRAEAGGTAISQVLLRLQAIGNVDADGLINVQGEIDNTNQELQDLFADLVRLEAQTGLSGRAFADSLSGLSGEDLGRVLGDRNRERLLNTQTQIDELTAKLVTLNEVNGQPDGGALDTLLTLINQRQGELGDFAANVDITREQLQELVSIDTLTGESNLSGVLNALVEGLGAEGENAAAALEVLGLNSVRTRDALLRTAGAGTVVREQIARASEEFENNDALATELANRYATVASEIETFRNAIQAAGNALGAPFLGPINRALAAANQFTAVFTDRLPAAIDAFQTSFAPLGEAIAAVFTGFNVDDFGTFLDGLIVSIANFDVTPIVDTFNFIVDNFGIISESLLAASAGFIALTGLVIAANVAFIAGPVLAYSAALAGLVFVFRNFDEIASGAQALFANLQIPEGIQPSVAGIQEAFSSLTTSLSSLGENLGASQFVSNLVASLPDLATFGITLASAFTQTIIDRIASLVGIFDGIVVAIDGLVSADFDTFVAGLGRVGESAVEGLLAPFRNINTALQSQLDLTGVSENVTTVLSLLETTFGDSIEFFRNLPNPIQLWLGGGDEAGIEPGTLAQAINTDIVGVLDDTSTELESTIRNFTTLFDEALAVPTGQDQSATQVFVDRFLEPFRTIELPEIDLSPIRDAFVDVFDAETLQSLASGFDGVSASLERLAGIGESGVAGQAVEGLGRLADILGRLAAFSLDQFIREINEFAAGIGLLGRFIDTFSANIGQFFSSFVETPIDQITGVTSALQGLFALGGSRNLTEVGEALSAIGSAVTDLALAPAINLAETIFGELDPEAIRTSLSGAITAALVEFPEIIPPQLSVARWGIQIAGVFEELETLFTETTIPLPEFDLTTVSTVTSALSASFLLEIELIRTQFANILTDIEFTLPDLSGLLEPFSALATQIRALFLPSSLFGGLLDLEIPSFLPGGGQTGADLLGLDTSALDDAVDSIGDRVTQARIDAQELGRNIPQGFEEGVSEEAETVTQRVIEVLFTNPVNELLTSWLTQSPSQVTQQLGQDIVAGLVIGLTDTTGIFEALNTLTATILEQFNLLGTQIGEVLTPNLALLNGQFLQVTTNLQLVSDGTLAYTPILIELTDAERQFGQVLTGEVIPPLQLLDQTQRLARSSARQLERAVRRLTAQYKRLAAALGDVRRQGGSTGGVPAQPGVSAPGASLARGGSFVVPNTINQENRGPTGGMLVEVHSGELVQVFNREMSRAVQSIPDNIAINRGIREPAFSGASITNQVNRTTNNNTTNEGATELHLHVQNPVSGNVLDSFDLMRSISRTRP